MDPAERVAHMLKSAEAYLGKPLTDVEARWAKALFIAVVVDSEVSRSEVETTS